MSMHRHTPTESYDDASDGGYTTDRCACGAVRVTAWTRDRRDPGNGSWSRPQYGAARSSQTDVTRLAEIRP